MTLFVVAAIAFVGMTIVGLGLFGRPDQSRPRCRACNADARPAAWDSPPVCACGARLDRAGAVRTRGRIRRPRVAILGILVVGVAAGVAGLSRWMDENGRTWWDFAPMAVVNAGLRGQYAGATETVERRRARGELDDDAFADAFLAANAASLPLQSHLKDFLDGARLNWLHQPFAMERLAEEMMGFDVPVVRSDVPTDGSRDVSFHVTALVGDSRQSPRVMWFFRLTRIAVNGVDVPFTSEFVPGVNSRILVSGSPGASFDAPDDARDATEFVVVVEGFLACSQVGVTAVGDPLIDSTAPPGTWEIDVSSMPVRREVRIPRAAPSSGAPR